MDEPLVPVSLALNQVQSWLNAGETEKAIQGCQEILTTEPGNMRAPALLRLAYEQAAPAPQAVQAAEEPIVTPATPANPTSGASLEDDFGDLFEKPEFEKPKWNGQLAWAILIPAVLTIVVGGIISMKASENAAVDVQNPPVLESHDHLQENEQRMDDLKKINDVIEAFYSENGAYPAQSQLQTLLSADATLKDLKDPRQGSKEKSGGIYVYLYRVYQTAEGPNTAYALTALFENSQGFGTQWGYGNGLENSEDARDLKFASVIGPELEEEAQLPPASEPRPDGPKVKPQTK